jgi:hypothetical protein
VRGKNILTPGTLNTILNTAPLIIQGASKLIKLILDRDVVSNQDQLTNPTTIEELKQEITRLETRLHDNSQADIEQIRLIEELAKQNETLAETLRQTMRRVMILNYITMLALAGSLCALLLLLYR